MSDSFPSQQNQPSYPDSQDVGGATRPSQDEPEEISSSQNNSEDLTAPENGEAWPDEDIEEAYRRALEAMDSVSWDEEPTPDEDSSGSPSADAPSADEDPQAEAPQTFQPDASLNSDEDTDGEKILDETEATQTLSESEDEAASGSDVESLGEEEGNALSEDESTAAPIEEAREILTEETGPSRVTPRQIIEAALFVGGSPLTTKKLCGILRGNFDASFVQESVDSLNAQYASQNRPYEIRFGEGGYRLALRTDFERIRSRVFGLGPKEVRLSQEALEVLALVAYKQPITKQEIEDCDKNNPSGILRQLLRRQLIEIQRGENGRSDVKYCTTNRFLELFGLADIDELPQADELNFK